MKTSMEKDTILFIDENNYGLGMEYSWFSKHYGEIAEHYGQPVKVFYKCGDTIDTWIDYNQAVQSKAGSRTERLQGALNDARCHINIKDIPQTDYFDREGYKQIIAPYDGAFVSSMWSQRTDKVSYSEYREEMDSGMFIEPKYDFIYTIEDGKLVITFNNEIDLENSLISLNSIFYKYQIDRKLPNRIFYTPDIVNELAVDTINLTNIDEEEQHEKLNGLSLQIKNYTYLITELQKDVRKLEEELKKAENSVLGFYDNYQEKLAEEAKKINIEKHLKVKIKELYNLEVTRDRLQKEYNRIHLNIVREYRVNIKVYTWEDVVKSDPIRVNGRIGEWFTTEEPIDDNAIVFYNGVIQNHEVSKYDKRQFKITDGYSILSLEAFEVGKFTIFNMTSKNKDRCIKKYVINGYNNKHRDTVEFALPVRQSLITYNGVDFDYEIHDNSTIYYPGGYKHSTNFVENDAKVQSINFSIVGQD